MHLSIVPDQGGDVSEPPHEALPDSVAIERKENAKSDILEVPRGEDVPSRADWIPAFWNFLGSLDRNDLIAELIQNDLDQGATRTEISFEPDRVVSQGNGAPVDEMGWQRLQRIYGAGKQVPAKKNRIGVKNHGLKTAFTIGDRILIRSDGQALFQLLYADGDDADPRPGASSPRQDLNSPKQGCSIDISLRKRDLRPAEGERLVLRAPTEQALEEIFRTACSAIPEQFAGIVSVSGIPRYEIPIHHWELGDVLFAFLCGRARSKKGGPLLFRRHCKVSGTFGDRPNGIIEEVAQRSGHCDSDLARRLPEFYRRDRHRYVVEVSWPVNARGEPIPNNGRYRYPLGYAAEQQDTLTGYGAHFNAPFISTSDRHAPRPDDESNEQLRTACCELLVDAVASHLVPTWGPTGLRAILPESRDADRNRPCTVIDSLITKRALPTLSREEAIRKLTKGRIGRRSLLSRARGNPRYDFVIPVPTWSKTAVSADLGILCPLAHTSGE